MKWLAAMIAMAALMGAGSAGAAAYVVNVLAPPTVVPVGSRGYMFGEATFPDVFLGLGDTLEINVDFGGDVELPPGNAVGDVYVLPGRGACIDNCLRQIWYPYIVGLGGTGVSIPVSVLTFNPDIVDPDTFDINTVGYFFASVPEPATWALMLAGVFLAGSVLRLQRRQPQGAMP